MISKQEYRNLKEYYDYQRLREYNKERLRERISHLIEQFDDDEEVNIDKMFERMWADMDEEDFDFQYFALRQIHFNLAFQAKHQSKFGCKQ